jgi:hypothetical protein
MPCFPSVAFIVTERGYAVLLEVSKKFDPCYDGRCTDEISSTGLHPYGFFSHLKKLAHERFRQIRRLIIRTGFRFGMPTDLSELAVDNGLIFSKI